MIRPVLVTPPAALPVSLEEFKAHAVIDFADDDALMQVYLQAAVSFMDGYAGVLGRCLVSQTWRQDFYGWQNRMRLPFPDISEVGVSYFDADGIEQTVPSNLFDVVEDRVGPWLWFREAFATPSLDDDRAAPVMVSFDAGYGDASDVPHPLKVAAMMLAAHWYSNREAVTGSRAPVSVPLGFDALILRHRRVGV